MTRFFQGLVIGAFIALTAGFILNFLDILTVSVTSIPSLQTGFYWIYDNLGLSLIPFVFILLAYFRSLNKLKYMLGNNPQPNQVMHKEQMLDIYISLFLGTGIVWTAIGMRSALIQSLSGLTAETAAQLGAFEILSRMVNGGTLVCLSTTIVGGIGGYALRLTKVWQVGEALDNFYYTKASKQFRQVSDLLVSINNWVQRICQTIDKVSSEEDNHVSNPDIKAPVKFTG